MIDTCVCVQVRQEDGSVKEEVRGARVRDRLSGKQWDIRAKIVVNATGVRGRCNNKQEFISLSLSL